MANGENPFVSRSGSAPTGGPFKSAKKLDFELAHAKADTDTERGALHHTLGSGPNQAASGNHKHDTLYMPKSDLQVYTPIVRGSGNGVMCTIGTDSTYKEVDGLVFINFEIFISNLNGATGTLTVELPFASDKKALIPGRENQTTGNMLQGILAAGSKIMTVLTYNNLSVLSANYTLLFTGWYPKDV